MYNYNYFDDTLKSVSSILTDNATSCVMITDLRSQSKCFSPTLEPIEEKQEEANVELSVVIPDCPTARDGYFDTDNEKTTNSTAISGYFDTSSETTSSSGETCYCSRGCTSSETTSSTSTESVYFARAEE